MNRETDPCYDGHKFCPGAMVSKRGLASGGLDIFFNKIACDRFYSKLCKLFCRGIPDRGRRTGVEEQEQPVQPAEVSKEEARSAESNIPRGHRFSQTGGF